MVLTWGAENDSHREISLIRERERERERELNKTRLLKLAQKSKFLTAGEACRTTSIF